MAFQESPIGPLVELAGIGVVTRRGGDVSARRPHVQAVANVLGSGLDRLAVMAEQQVPAAAACPSRQSGGQLPMLGLQCRQRLLAGSAVHIEHPETGWLAGRYADVGFWKLTPHLSDHVRVGC